MEQMNISYLHWDSDFFGFSVARIDVGDANETTVARQIERLQNDGVHLIYIFSKRLLTIKGFNAYLVDQKRSYLLLNPSNVPTKCKATVVTNRPEKLYKLAWQAGEYSRYKIDPNISDDIFKRMYSLWADNSVSGQIADYVLACNEDDEYKGFITAKIKNNTLSIGLIATDNKYRGQGIGSCLIQEIKNIAAQQKLALEVTTQADNLKACAFYEHNGFVVDHQEYIYHVWTNRNQQ